MQQIRTQPAGPKAFRLYSIVRDTYRHDTRARTSGAKLDTAKVARAVQITTGRFCPDILNIHPTRCCMPWLSAWSHRSSTARTL